MMRIGTVEILRTRVYPLDAESVAPTRQEMIVSPGVFDLYRDGDTTFWMMRGRLNLRGVQRLGDGLFALRGADEPSDVEVEFPSRRFGPDEWSELLACPEFVDGEAQRVRVTLDGAS